MAVPVSRISQGAAVFCVRNASIARVVRSMPSRSTSRHFCDATRCRRRCSTTISTSAGSSRRRRSGASARNGDANALHARLRRDGSSVVSVALEPTACSSARLELPPEVVSGSVLVASAQFVGARRLDVAAPPRQKSAAFPCAIGLHTFSLAPLTAAAPPTHAGHA